MGLKHVGGKADSVALFEWLKIEVYFIFKLLGWVGYIPRSSDTPICLHRSSSNSKIPPRKIPNLESKELSNLTHPLTSFLRDLQEMFLPMDLKNITRKSVQISRKAFLYVEIPEFHRRRTFCMPMYIRWRTINGTSWDVLWSSSHSQELLWKMFGFVHTIIPFHCITVVLQLFGK